MANKNTIEITLSVDDKGSVTVRQFGEGTKKAFQDTEKSAEDLSKSTSSLFSTMKSHWVALSVAGLAAVYGITKAIGAVISATREWVGLANVQEAAEKRLEAVIRATGGAAGYTIGQLKEMASQMQSVTTVGDEVILSGMSILSTFRNIKGDVFKDASMAALDMVTVMRQGKVTAEALDSQMIQLGKALNDPVEGLAALSRVGVQFTAEQEATIKGLVETGDVMGAQRVILEELKNEFGGTAAMMADTFAGAGSQARNALGDLKEELGFIITKNSFFIEIQKLATRTFTEWGQKVKDNREYLISLAKDGVLWLVECLVKALDTIRFFHNAWLGIKLVGHGAIHAIAVALDELLRGMRALGSPLDYIFKGLVKIGAVETNPFDKLEEALGQFRLSSGDLVDDTWRDIEETNRAYDTVIDKIRGWEGQIRAIPAAHVDAAESVKKTMKTTAAEIQKTANDMSEDVHLSIRETVIAEKEFIASLAINQAKEVAKTVKETERELTGLEEYWQHTYDNIHDATADFFYDILRNAKLSFDSIKDWFVRLIAEMLATAAANPIKIAIGSVMGVGAGGTALAGTGGGGVDSLFDLSGVSKLISGLGAAGWGLTIPGAGVGGPMGMASGLGTAGTLGAINWANVAGYLGLAYEAFNLFKSIGEGEYMTSGGIAIGAGIGAFLGGGPVGAALGAGVGDLVGGILDSIFGLGKDEPEFTLSEHNPRYGQDQARWIKGRGVGTGYWPEFSSDWEAQPTVAYTAIAQAYAKGRKEIAENFNESMNTFMEALPSEYLTVVEDALAGMDFTWNAPGYRYEFANAQEVIENLLLNYADFLAGKFDEIVNVVGAAYFEQDISGSDLFGKLTAGKQGQVKNLLSGGDLTGEQFQSFLEEWQALATVMAGFEALLAPTIAKMTTYEQVTKAVGDQFDAYIDTLERAGVEVSKLGDLEQMRADVIAREVTALQDSFWTDFTEEMKLAYSGMTDYEKKVYQITQRFAEYIAQAEDLGMSEDRLAEIREWEKMALDSLTESADEAVEAVDNLSDRLRQMEQLSNAMSLMAGGGGNTRMEQISARYDWRSYGGKYDLGGGLYNWDNIINEILSMNLSLEGAENVAAALGITLDQLLSDFDYIADQFTQMKAAAASLKTSLEDRYMQATMSGEDYAKWKAGAEYSATLSQLDDLRRQGIISLSERNTMRQQAWAVYQADIEAATDAAKDQFRGLIDAAYDAWKGLADSIGDSILRLQTSSDNPADVMERLGVQAQAIRDYTGGMNLQAYLGTLGTDEDRRSAIKDMMDLYGGYLNIAQEAYQRPSQEYQAIYQEVLAAYQMMEGIAEGYMSEFDVQTEQLEVLKQIAINTGLYGSYDTGTEYVPRTGPYLLHQGEKVVKAGESSGNVYFGDIVIQGVSNGDEAVKKFQDYLRSPVGRREIFQAARGR